MYNNESYPLGVDISYWQHDADNVCMFDFNKLNSKCKFVAIRATISNYYKDPWFRYSWERVTIPRIAYHVINPTVDGVYQTNYFLNFVQPNEHDRLCLDLELHAGQTKSRITQVVLDSINIIKQATGHYPMIYSRASWINDFLEVRSLPRLDWWLAHYYTKRPHPEYTPEFAYNPTLPNYVDSFLIHQTSEGGPGNVYGSISYYIDLDRWNGSEDDIRSYFGYKDYNVYLPIITNPVSKPVNPMPEPNRNPYNRNRVNQEIQ